MTILKRIIYASLDVIIIAFLPFWYFLYLSYYLLKSTLNNQTLNTESITKRIAILTPSSPPDVDGGIAGAHYNMYRLLKQNGYHVSLFSFSHLKQKPTDPQIKCIPEPSNREKFIKRKLWLCNFFFYKRIFKKHAYQTFDIVHTSFAIKALNPVLLEYDPTLIITSDQGIPAMFLSKKLNAKKIVYVHHNPARFYKINDLVVNAWLDIKMAVYLEKKFYKKINCLLHPSKYMDSLVRNTHAYTGASTVLFNIMEYQSLDKVQKSVFPNKCDYYVYIPSAGNPIKGAAYVKPIIKKLCAALNTKTILFYLSGEIREGQKKELYESNPKNAVLFLPGRTAFNVNMGYAKSCNIAVSPTIVDNFSMALLEANYLGLPVITFDTGGNSEIIENGKNGYIIPNKNIDKLAKKSAYVLSNLSNYNNCKEYIQSKFSHEKFLNGFDELIKNMETT